MPVRNDRDPRAVRAPRYGRDTPEYARVANLSDAVFAIAMTLLVLALEMPDVPADRLAGALAANFPHYIAFVLSFVLVANVWWAHHKFFALLAWIEPWIIGLNLGLLGLVALVPFPTSLIGAAPMAGAAVVPFVALFVVVHALFLALLVRARALAAWRIPMPPGLYPWLLAGWIGHLALMVAALVVALAWPLGGLVLAAVSGTVVGIAMKRLAPRAYGEWG